jgi:hypothetical protein
MNINTNQKKIIARAIKLLEPYAAKEKRVSESTCYFIVRGDEIPEFDCCDDEKCVKQSLKNIVVEYGKDTEIETCYSRDYGDPDKIERCNICLRPLNEFMTWISEEFSHHRRYSVKRKDLTDPSTAYDVKAMLGSIPSCDYSISVRAKHLADTGSHELLKKEQKFQDEFLDDVVDYAKIVIK